MRFVREDGSFDHQAIDEAFRARMRHYELFSEKVPGVMTLHAWKNAVMDALETDILIERRRWQRENALVETFKGIAG